MLYLLRVLENLQMLFFIIAIFTGCFIMVISVFRYVDPKTKPINDWVYILFLSALIGWILIPFNISHDYIQKELDRLHDENKQQLEMLILAKNEIAKAKVFLEINDLEDKYAKFDSTFSDDKSTSVQ